VEEKKLSCVLMCCGRVTIFTVRKKAFENRNFNLSCLWLLGIGRCGSRRCRNYDIAENCRQTWPQLKS
jgi:hypothetical protein